MEERVEHLEIVLARLHDRSLQVDIDECAFDETNLQYVCLIIAGIWIYQAKLFAVADRESASCMKDVQGFLRFCQSSIGE